MMTRSDVFGAHDIDEYRERESQLMTIINERKCNTLIFSMVMMPTTKTVGDNEEKMTMMTVGPERSDGDCMQFSHKPRDRWQDYKSCQGAMWCRHLVVDEVQVVFWARVHSPPLQPRCMSASIHQV